MTALTQHAPVLEIYQDIANLTSRMLAAANASNWDLVLNHGQEYVWSGCASWNRASRWTKPPAA